MASGIATALLKGCDRAGRVKNYDMAVLEVDEHDAAALMAYEPGDELYVLYGTDTLELAYQVFDQMKAIAQSRAADSADKEVQA